MVALCLLYRGSSSLAEATAAATMIECLNAVGAATRWWVLRVLGEEVARGKRGDGMVPTLDRQKRPRLF